MKLRFWIILAALAATALPGTLWATNTVLSGIFDGSEARIAPLPGTCPGATALGYRAVSGIQVSASGSYSVVDAFNNLGVDVTALLYSGSFNPNAPQSNLLTAGGIDEWDEVGLSSGTNYVLVVQHWCFNREGAWAVTFSGPGSVNSASAVSVPALTQGSFSGADPIADTDCGDSQYRQVGPVQVTRSGLYYYADISIYHAVDVCLQVYTAPFNPANPNANRVGDDMDDLGVVELQAGEDYYFVAQPFGDTDLGEYFFVFAPPAPFRITHAMAGGWFEPATAGQGFLMDVFDNANSMFLAWFTYDLERPGAGASAMIGDPGHRWLTAQGPFSGDTAELDISWTSGMIFDSGTPPFSQTQDGSITVEFFDCYTGLVTYDLGSAGVQGQVPIQRLGNDAVDLCQALYEGPGQPGPL
jgi:hypothetical protein